MPRPCIVRRPILYPELYFGDLVAPGALCLFSIEGAACQYFAQTTRSCSHPGNNSHGRRAAFGVLDKLHHPHIVLVHGISEDVTLGSIRGIAQDLATNSQTNRDVELYELKDNHDFNCPESPVEIYSAVLNVLDQ